MTINEQVKLFSDLLENLRKVTYFSKNDFDTLEGKAKMYVRKFFGDKSHYLEELERIKYSPQIYFGGSDKNYFATFFESGVKTLCNLIVVIIEDLKLSTNYETAIIKNITNKKSNKPFVQKKRNSITDKEIHILIASPGDVIEERELILNSLESKFRRAGYETKCGHRIIVRGWEELATQSGYGQDIINTQILSKIDIVLAVFKHKLGTPTKDLKTGNERSKSGTAEELLFALRNDDLVNPPLGMAYFYSEAPKMSFDSPNLKIALKNWKELRKFKEEIKDDILYKSYKSEEDLLNNACDDLVKNIETYFV